MLSFHFFPLKVQGLEGRVVVPGPHITPGATGQTRNQRTWSQERGPALQVQDEPRPRIQWKSLHCCPAPMPPRTWTSIDLARSLGFHTCRMVAWPCSLKKKPPSWVWFCFSGYESRQKRNKAQCPSLPKQFQVIFFVGSRRCQAETNPSDHAGSDGLRAHDDPARARTPRPQQGGRRAADCGVGT